MADLAIANTLSTVKMPETPPVISFGDRLRENLDTVQQLRVDAARFVGRHASQPL
jgi:hypothetical protein